MNQNLILVPNKKQLFSDLGYEPHPKQWLVHDSTARFRVMMCGRRLGKSKCAAYEAIAAALIPRQMIWVVAPTYNLSEKVFREIFWELNRNNKLKLLLRSASYSSMEIELVNGSKIIGKSADNPVSLVGEGVDFLIIDECALIKEDVWNQALRPTLADKKGKALFISTPRGMNWFYEMFSRGQKRLNETESWSFPSSDNPYLDPLEIKDAEETTPSLIFRQEWLAIPVAEQDMYFSWELIQSCIDETIPQLEFRDHPKHEYYLGLDVARLGQDMSVFIISEKSWNDGKIRIVKVLEIEHQLINQAIGRAKYLNDKFKFNKIFIDETGLGSGVVDGLKEQVGPAVQGITFTVEEKENLYSNLKMQMEKGNLKYPKHKKMLAEMQDLRYEYSTQGRMKIHHSDNGHDDFPDALALSIAFAKQKATFKPMIV